MGVLSKFLIDKLGLTIHQGTCYEMVHTWNPKCHEVMVDAWWNSWLFAFKNYLVVYSMANIVAVRDLRYFRWKNVLTDSFRSSFFVATNVATFMWSMCYIRKKLGFFTVLTLGLINGILSSFSIFIESRKRRPTLALYLANLASETGFRQLVSHGYLKNVPNGVIIMFGIGLAGLLHLYQRNHLHDMMERSLEYFLVLDESREIYNEYAIRMMYSPFSKLLLTLRQKFRNNVLCEHQNSCFSRVVEIFWKQFHRGLIWNVCLAVVNNGTSVWRHPVIFLCSLLKFRTLRLPLFCGLLAALFQASRCGYRWIANKNAQLSYCGAISAMSLLVYPNVPIATYVFWRFVEVFYYTYCSRFTISHGDALLYALSTGFIAWNAIIEPHNIRDGYWKYLVGLTGKRIELLNRCMYDVFGYGSSKKFPDFKPELDPRYTSFGQIHCGNLK